MDMSAKSSISMQLNTHIENYNFHIENIDL